MKYSHKAIRHKLKFNFLMIENNPIKQYIFIFINACFQYVQFIITLGNGYMYIIQSDSFFNLLPLPSLL